jgi:mono/diheme cytochrome c family protein
MSSSSERKPLAGRALLAASTCLLLSLSPAALSARDDTPPDLAGAKNPVVLDDAKATYFAKQFRANCARCHGEGGGGEGDDAAVQAVPPTRFTDAAHMATRTDGQLFWQIAEGGAPRCEMPAFGPGSAKSWDDEKMWGMVAYLRRLAQQGPP